MAILNKKSIPRDNELKESKTKMLKSILNNVKYSFLGKTGFIIKQIENGYYPERFAKK